MGIETGVEDDMAGFVLALMLLAGADAQPSVRHDRAATAFRVAAWARERGDAHAMLAAARMVADAGVRTEDAKPAFLALADEAVAMAPGDARIVEMASAIRDAAPRGILRGPLGDGPIVMRHLLLAGATAAWPIQAQGGTTAIVSAVGDGDANIDLRVLRGSVTVCADVARDPNPMCRWRVAQDATFRIAVSNRGRVATRVVVLSN